MVNTKYYVGDIPVGNDLYHHGIKGQKWGIRRFQNLDGTLTELGKRRYQYSNAKQIYKAFASEKHKQHLRGQKYDHAYNETKLSAELKSDLASKAKELSKYSRKLVDADNEFNTANLAAEKRISELIKSGKVDPAITYDDAFKLKDKVIMDRAAKVKAVEQASEEYERKIKEYVDDMIGEYGRQPISMGLTSSTTFAIRDAADHLLRSYDDTLFTYKGKK